MEGQAGRRQLLQLRIANVICDVVVIVVEFVADCGSAVRHSKLPKSRSSHIITTTATVSAEVVKQVVPRCRPKTRLAAQLAAILICVIAGINY